MKSKIEILPQIKLTGEQVQSLKGGNIRIKLDQKQLFWIAMQLGWRKFPWEKIGRFSNGMTWILKIISSSFGNRRAENGANCQ